MAGAQGFEPHLPDPESGVLPLNYAPTARQKYAMLRGFRQLWRCECRDGKPPAIVRWGLPIASYGRFVNRPAPVHRIVCWWRCLCRSGEGGHAEGRPPVRNSHATTFAGREHQFRMTVPSMAFACCISSSIGVSARASSAPVMKTWPSSPAAVTRSTT